MSDTNNNPALARLQALLAAGTISQDDFNLLAASHRPPAAVARKPAPRARQRAADGAVQVGGDVHAPVTVHHQVVHAAPDSAAERAAAQAEVLRRQYLGRVWGQANAVSLLAGSKQRDGVRLAAVYTALMTDRPAQPKPSRGKSGVARGVLPEHLARARSSALAVLDSDRRLVLLGGPGSGKSTFVNYVAQAMAGEALGPDDEMGKPNLDTLRAPLPADEDDVDDGPALRQRKKTPKPQPWRHGALLPLVVVLRDLAAQLPPPGHAACAEHVWQHLCGVLQAASMAEFAPALKAELQAGRVLVMFDGLDEVPEADTRRERIQQAVSDFAASFGTCRVLVTCRTYAYQHQEWKLPGFAEATLLPFSAGQIRAFVQAWYAHMADLQRLSAEAAQGHAAQLLRQALHNPRVRELAERPLLLTLFARLQTDQGGDLPERREALYKAAVNLLLNDWERLKLRRRADGSTEDPEPSLSEALEASREAIRQQLDRLAFEAHRDQSQLTGTADIRQADLIDALLRASPRKRDEQRVLQLRSYLRDRAGILVEHGVDMLQFPHRSFQEYLAACHLANDGFPDQLAQLLRGDPQRWREVTLLAAADAASGNVSLPTWALVEALCPAPPPVKPAEPPAAATPDHWGALLASQVLVASGLHGAPGEQHLSKRQRVVDWQLALLCGRALPAVERALAGRTLDALGDPRPEVVTLADMQFCEVPAGPFHMGSDEYDDEKPRHVVDLGQPFWMARYPVTRAQWRLFVEQCGHRQASAASLQGRGNEPVTDVNWHDAQAFCQGLTRLWRDRLPTGWVVDLPSEAEWEKAARGGLELPREPRCGPVEALRGSAPPQRGRSARLANPLPERRYPCGDDLGPGGGNVAMAVGSTSAAGAFAEGASPYGVEDMSGNVWEWTASAYRPYPFQPLAVDPSGAAGSRVVRGGSWGGHRDDARCASRYGYSPGDRNLGLGFRVVLRSSPVLKR